MGNDSWIQASTTHMLAMSAECESVINELPEVASPAAPTGVALVQAGGATHSAERGRGALTIPFSSGGMTCASLKVRKIQKTTCQECAQLPRGKA